MMPKSSRQVGRILEELLAEVGPVKMGFRVQGMVAHIMLAQGYRILEVNSSGHPDIIAQGNGGVIRVEVEADTRGIGVHLPQPADLVSLHTHAPGDQGYFAVVICGPLPSWIVIDSYRLENRSIKLSLPLLETLSNRSLSEDWSRLFEQLVIQNGTTLKNFTFEWLARQALNQRCLISWTGHNLKVSLNNLVLPTVQ
jgi:hypothetical protein